ncbi:hypothetical protein AGDE_00233 [Angomonas deanei]|uniref:Leucine Rich repeat n=1 Tax=Angomonas deanei TaxID=59799 RepID=S9WR50_9TRYP|nr:hypothetical protein AGDE_02072 [Angomonas deanei]EPY43688.1 hypothetical protein AGDE_00233 [Angomonas deanei]CAD2213188.1 hypothetical protein, conserved [Angomonas deanei]|eukprot:EPY41851.1 hypothetical protein AGDE_02072 [Angomonas deanei]
MADNANGELTTAKVLQVSKQYDIELVYQAVLCNCALTSLSNGLQNCNALSILDLSRNKLTNLSGLEHVAGTLTVLNAAENALTDVSAVGALSHLTKLLLEGNQLSAKASLAPITKLTALHEVVFTRSVVLEGDTEPFVMDNPICADKKTYAAIVREMFGNVFWVDGVHRAVSEGQEGASPTAAASAEKNVKKLEEITKNTTKQLEGKEVKHLEALLAEVKSA